MNDPKRILDVTAGDSASTLERDLVASLKPDEGAQSAVWKNLSAQVGLAAGASAVVGAATAKAVTSGSLVGGATSTAGVGSAVGTATGTGTTGLAATGGLAGAGTAVSVTAASGAAASSTAASSTAVAAATSLGLLPKVGLVLALTAPAVGVGLWTNEPASPSPNDTQGRAPQTIAPTPSREAQPTENDSEATLETPEAPATEKAEPPKNQSATRKPPQPRHTGSVAQGTSPTVPTPQSASLLSAENQLLRKARQEMQQGNPNAALRTLGTLDAQVKNGVLNQERLLLKIQALTARGDKARARAAATRFLRAYPSSPYAEHLKATVLPPTK